MSYGRGDVVVAVDPFKDEGAGRPFLVISGEETPFHGEQFICLSLTTRTWYERRVPVDEDDWTVGGAPVSSSIMPWSVNTIKREWIEYHQGTLRDEVVGEAVAQLVSYVD